MVISAWILVYLIGAYMVFRTSRTLFSPPMLVIFYLGQYLLGGIFFTIIASHPLTLIFPAAAAFLFGSGALLAWLFGAYVPVPPKGKVAEPSLYLPEEASTAYKAAASFGTLIAFLAGFIVLALRGSPLWGSISRIEVPQGLGPLVRLITVGIPWSVALWLLAYYRWKRQTSLYLVSALFLFGAVILTLLGYKGYVLDLVLFLILLVACAQGGYMRKGVVVGLLALAVFSALAVLMAGPARGALSRGLFLLLRRFIVESSIGFDFLIYNWVPLSGFYRGKTLAWDFTSSLSEISQGILYSSQEPFVRFLHNQFRELQTPFALTIGLIGDLYANFNVIGLLLGMLLFGLVMQVLYSWSTRVKKHMLFWPVLVWLGFTLAQGASTGSFLWVLVSRMFSLALFYLPVLWLYLDLYLPFTLRKKRSPMRG